MFTGDVMQEVREAESEVAFLLGRNECMKSMIVQPRGKCTIKIKKVY